MILPAQIVMLLISENSMKLQIIWGKLVNFVYASSVIMLLMIKQHVLLVIIAVIFVMAQTIMTAKFAMKPNKGFTK